MPPASPAPALARAGLPRHRLKGLGGGPELKTNYRASSGGTAEVMPLGGSPQAAKKSCLPVLDETVSRACDLEVSSNTEGTSPREVAEEGDAVTSTSRTARHGLRQNHWIPKEARTCSSLQAADALSQVKTLHDLVIDVRRADKFGVIEGITRSLCKQRGEVVYGHFGRQVVADVGRVDASGRTRGEDATDAVEDARDAAVAARSVTVDNGLGEGSGVGSRELLHNHFRQVDNGIGEQLVRNLHADRILRGNELHL